MMMVRFWEPFGSMIMVLCRAMLTRGVVLIYDRSTVTVFLPRLAVRCGRYANDTDTAQSSWPAGIPMLPRSDLPSAHSGCIVWVSTPNGHHSRVDLTMWCCSPLDARIVPCAGVWLLREPTHFKRGWSTRIIVSV